MRGKRASLLIIVFLSLSVLLSATQYARADTSLVPPPTNLTATAVSSSEIHLSWTAPTGVGLVVTGYEIERSTDGGSTWPPTPLVANTGSTATTYSDTGGLTHTTTYTYRVHTVTAIGTSFPSDTASATTFAVAPSSPTGLVATAASSSQIGLTWTAPTDNGGSAITGYKIEKSTDGGSTWSTLVNTCGTSTRCSDTGLPHTTTFTYRVSAINSVGTGPPSTTASATTLAVAPSPPTGLAASASSSSQISLSWTAPTDNGGSAITGYKIEKSTDGGTTWSTLVANTGNTAATYSDTGLTHTTTYTYRVSAINSIGTSSASSVASATTPIAAPSLPTGVTATAASSSQVGLTWTAPADNGGSAITGYKIERSTDGGTTWTTLVANTGNTAATYSDTGLTRATAYTYRVSAINSAGTGSLSITASATTLAVAPSSPTGLVATAASSSQIGLTWTAPTDNGGSAITGYKIEKSTDGGSTWSTLVNTCGTSTRCSDTGLPHTTTFTYRVSAINSVGTGPPSTTASATTLAVAPSPPTGLAASASSSSQISLSWTAPTDNGGSAITGYKIEKSTDGGTTWSTLVANTGNTAATYSDTGLTHTTTYTYRVSAINSIGTSSASSVASATTPIAAPSLPTGVTATAASSSQVGLTWTAPADNGGSAITGYKIERSTDGGTTWSTLVANTGNTAA